MWTRRLALLGIALSWIAAPLVAQEAIYLNLESEGSASMFFSKNNKRIFLLDGGRGTGGITGLASDGGLSLSALLRDGYDEVVIICSHPHDDHYNGLRELIRSDPAMPRFSKVRFVDSGIDSSKSLYHEFLRCYPRYSRDSVTYHSAEGNNAFSTFVSPTDGVVARNFVYRPRESAGAMAGPLLWSLFFRKMGSPQDSSTSMMRTHLW